MCYPSAFTRTYGPNYRGDCQREEPPILFKALCCFGMIFFVFLMIFVAYNDHQVCQLQLTNCKITSIETIRSYPLPGERIDHFYVDQTYVIHPVKNPTAQYAIECWGPRCKDKLILDKQLECYYDGITAPRESCRKFSKNDL